jgi:hypothetical protein
VLMCSCVVYIFLFNEVDTVHMCVVYPPPSLCLSMTLLYYHRSGLIDLYEFIRLYKQLSDVLTSKEMSKSFVEINDAGPGFLLSLRTIECAERIVQIQKGNGTGITYIHMTHIYV